MKRAIDLLHQGRITQTAFNVACMIYGREAAGAPARFSDLTCLSLSERHIRRLVDTLISVGLVRRVKTLLFALREEPSREQREPQVDQFVEVEAPPAWQNTFGGKPTIQRRKASKVKKALARYKPDDILDSILEKAKMARYPYAYLATVIDSRGVILPHAKKEKKPCPKQDTPPNPSNAKQVPLSPSPSKPNELSSEPVSSIPFNLVDALTL